MRVNFVINTNSYSDSKYQYKYKSIIHKYKI